MRTISTRRIVQITFIVVGLILIGGALAPRFRGPSFPGTFRLNEPHTCALYQDTMSEDGFMGYIPNPPTIACDTAFFGGAITCTVHSDKGDFKFQGTAFPKEGQLVVSTLAVDDDGISLQLVCDAKGRCEFALLWSKKTMKGVACLEDAVLHPLDEGKEL